MNVMGWVLKSKVNLSIPSAHQIKCVKKFDIILVFADFSSLKFILLSSLNVKFILLNFDEHL